MPKPCRAPEEVASIRDRILSAALDIISIEGFDGLTMRRLGDHLGVAAKTVYNYYASKEEIYLRVVEEGFVQLHNDLSTAIQFKGSPEKRMERLFSAYVRFGIEKPNYYNIMFTYNVPKYADYVGTLLETTAKKQKMTALKVADLVMTFFKDLGLGTQREDLLFKVWSLLHGPVSLYNSRVMQEVSDRSDAVLKQLTDDVVRYVSDEVMRSRALAKRLCDVGLPNQLMI